MTHDPQNNNSQSAKPQDVLSTADYRNYRNVRAVSVFFVLLGSIAMLCGLATATIEPPPGSDEVSLPVSIAITIVGFAGAVGGIATLRGNPKWAKLIYGIAAIYIFVIPIGTILSYVLLTGLNRYLDSKTMLAERDISPPA